MIPSKPGYYWAQLLAKELEKYPWLEQYTWLIVEVYETPFNGSILLRGCVCGHEEYFELDQFIYWIGPLTTPIFPTDKPYWIREGIN